MSVPSRIRSGVAGSSANVLGVKSSTIEWTRQELLAARSWLAAAARRVASAAAVAAGAEGAGEAREDLCPARAFNAGLRRLGQPAEAPYEIDTIVDYQIVGDVLSGRGYKTADIENIMYRNWQRFFEKWLPSEIG